MKYLLIPVLFITIVFNANAQAADLGVGAIGLVVSDIDESEKFYVDILGMLPDGGFELSREWSLEAGMSDGLPFAVKIFRMQNKNTSTVLKLAYFKEKVNKQQLKHIAQKSGVNYLTFYYNDLDSIRKKIVEADIPIVGEVKGSTYKLLIIQDPDGVFVELVKEK